MVIVVSSSSMYVVKKGGKAERQQNNSNNGNNGSSNDNNSLVNGGGLYVVCVKQQRQKTNKNNLEKITTRPPAFPSSLFHPSPSLLLPLPSPRATTTNIANRTKKKWDSKNATTETLEVGEKGKGCKRYVYTKEIMGLGGRDKGKEYPRFGYNSSLLF